MKADERGAWIPGVKDALNNVMLEVVKMNRKQ